MNSLIVEKRRFFPKEKQKRGKIEKSPRPMCNVGDVAMEKVFRDGLFASLSVREPKMI